MFKDSEPVLSNNFDKILLISKATALKVLSKRKIKIWSTHTHRMMYGLRISEQLYCSGVNMHLYIIKARPCDRLILNRLGTL